MRNQPGFLPLKPSYSRDAPANHDTRIQPVIRGEGPEVLETLRTQVEKRLCSGERRTDLVWGLWRVRAGQRGHVMPVGAAVFVEVDARKDTHGALYMEILII